MDRTVHVNGQPTKPMPESSSARVDKSALLAEIDFGMAGRSVDFILDGWGEQEPGHRWSVGSESSVRLPVSGLTSDCVVIVDVIPWCDAACLPVQAVMLAVNGRLLATFRVSDHRVLAFEVPGGSAIGASPILTFSHLHCGVSRPATGFDRAGLPLGLMVTSIRVFRIPPSGGEVTLPALPDTENVADAVGALTGMSLSQLACGFESIGHNCEFGLVQRDLGAEPLGLLRFASLVTHKLVDGLMARFEGAGSPGTTRIYVSDPPDPEFKVHEQRYYLWYSVGKTPEEMTQAAVHRQQCRRLAFLRRKFLDDLRMGEKIYVLTRPELLTAPEALAVFCALQIEGRNTVLWTVHGDPDRAGQVDRIRPGLLRGHLGVTDDRDYASLDNWVSVLINAYVLGVPAKGKQSFFEKKDQKTFGHSGRFNSLRQR